VNPLFQILYVEDNVQDADLTLTYFFEHAGDFKIEIAKTGQECLDRLSKNTYDLLLLDHRLPDMEGLDVLRKLAHARIAVPAVIVTGAGDEELVVQALHLGASDYVSKTDNYLEPLPDLLRGVIEEDRFKKSQGLITSVQMRVLYIEHNSMDVELTLRHFADAAPQFEIDAVHTSNDALTRLRQQPPYDAVLADLRMPDQNGLDFVREAKHLHIPLPPFIILSGKGDEAAAIASLKLGATDYVTKRPGYLDTLPCTIDRAITHDRLNRLNRQLRTELDEHKQAEIERQNLEEQLRVSQKLEAIGKLAGGIAHDFNNMLNIILGYGQFAIEKLPLDSPIRSDVETMIKAANKAARLTHQLLAFSRKQMLQPMPLDLNVIITAIDKMLRRILGEDIELVHSLAPDLGVVMADQDQIEQVLMNLVINARDAMPEGGKLTVETCNVEIDNEYSAHHVAMKPGQYVMMAVTDTGYGMDEQTKSKIFEPYFTTKENGKGTGLGLSTVYGVIRQSGGNVWVYSEPGQGTTFKIYFPRELSAEALVQVTPAVKTCTGGTETILLVEDEEAVRNLTKRILSTAGYCVLTAANGNEALEIFKTHQKEIHLLLTDIVMPQMGGKVLAEQLLRIMPKLKVIFMSGYADNAITTQGLLDNNTLFIGKPFSATDMLRKIREAFGHEEKAHVRIETQKQRLAIKTVPLDVLDKLCKAVKSARYDEIIQLISTVRTMQPDVADRLQKMADIFDYDGLLGLINPNNRDQE